MRFELAYKRFGAHAILIDWPSVINETILVDILNFKSKIDSNNLEGVIQTTNAYNALLVNYDDSIDFEQQVILLKTLYNSKSEIIENTSKLWNIPVCYDASFGIDLDTISTEKKLPKDEIIKRHSQTIYTVYFIGFLPGFLYLGGLDESISIPRKASPRLKIDKGSVAIGGLQTGVYPQESPGGWHIIGNSPINFFDVLKASPCFAKAGDKIKFYPISLKKHNAIKTLVDANVYLMESELL